MSLDSKDPGFKEHQSPAPGRHALQAPPPQRERGTAPEGKAHATRAPVVLVVDEKQFFRCELAARIAQMFSIRVEQAGSLQEAATAARDRQFDIVIFGNPAWEDGVAFYIDLLNRRASPLQFILFTEDRSDLSLYFEDVLEIVRKPDFEGLIAAADWSAIPLDNLGP